MLDIFVDADGCPVKDEVYRVAQRYGLKVFVVANAGLRVPPSAVIELVLVGGGFNAADDWIAEHVQASDIVVTADIPLADRCLQNGARVLTPSGRVYSEKNIGGALASRALLQDLRQMGTITGGPPVFGKRDRSRFLSRLDETVQALKRQGR